MAALDFATLADRTATGEIDTVLVCLIDMQGRIMGKRFTARHFVDSAHAETHCCNYLLATDIAMSTPDGFAATSWEKGYGDYVLKPDLTTLRPVPWLPATAMVLCDILDHATHAPVAHAPRQMLKQQVARAQALGLTPLMATELEFFLFAKSYDAYRRKGYRGFAPLAGFNADYSIQLTSKEEHVMRPVRNQLLAAGVPVENSKGEAETGQEELNIRYADAVAACDHHVIAKLAVKDIAGQHGHSATFLAKWDATRVGSAAHLHQSLGTPQGPAFHDPSAPHGMSDTMRSYVAGLLAHTAEMTVFLAPYVNSYKRFTKGTFAPTGIAWSVDNRTAGYRLVGENTPGVRIECRIPGSDVNPYLAAAAQLAAGLNGIEAALTLEPAVNGDVYAMGSVPTIPATLTAATRALRGSAMLRRAFGDAVVDHYVRAAEVEQEAFEAAVTDWEIERGFERA